MSEYIEREAFIKKLENEADKSSDLEQVMWERDMALETLKEHGIGFCEKSENDLAVKLFGSYITRDKEYIQAWLESEVEDNDT